jgi:hypothetical protein
VAVVWMWAMVGGGPGGHTYIHALGYGVGLMMRGGHRKGRAWWAAYHRAEIWERGFTGASRVCLSQSFYFPETNCSLTLERVGPGFISVQDTQNENKLSLWHRIVVHLPA